MDSFTLRKRWIIH